MSNKTKELIICLVTVAILLLTLVTDVFAAGEDLNDLLGDTNSEYDSIGNRIDNNTTNNTQNNSTNNSLNKNTNNSNRNNAGGIPNTGVDYSVVFIIAICGISAIYAYKKIKDYNNF